MGFNFNRSGGAGGKIPRRPRLLSSTGGNWVGGLMIDTPTSPQFVLNNSIILGSIFETLFTSASGAGQTSFSLSVGSNTWIDMIGWVVYGTDGTPRPGGVSNFSINGVNLVDYPIYDGGNQVFAQGLYDVYGYGVSVDMSFVRAPSLAYIKPIQPRTIITESGMVVHPPGLYGNYVYRDI